MEKQINDFFRFSWNEGKDRSPHNNYTWKRFKTWVSSVSDSLAGSILSGKFIAICEDEKQAGSFRRDCAKAVGELGMKDKAVGILLNLAEDEKQEGSLRRSCAYTLGNLELKEKTMVERLLHLAEDEKQSGDLRRSCAEAVGNLGMKDKAVVERSLHLAEDEKKAVYLRRNCAETLGKLGIKDKAVDILINLYLRKKINMNLRPNPFIIPCRS